MKFTVIFITLLSISTTWAIKQKVEEPIDKREAPVGYSSSQHSSHGYQTPSLGHQDASAISVGAGYSIGSAKPSFAYGGQDSGAGIQLSSGGLPSSGHATIQLAPITLQPNNGAIAGTDLAQLMSQLSHGFNSGAFSFQSPSDVGGSYQTLTSGGQEYSLPQFTYGAPKQQYSGSHLSEHSIPSIPSYATGSKGLGSFGSTGPVLFTPSESQGHTSQPALNYGAPLSSGHSFGDAGGLSFGGAGNSLAGLSLGGGHQFGGSYKALSGGYTFPGKTNFKPSAFLGTSGNSDSVHSLSGLSGLSGSYGAPQFGSISGSHAFSGGNADLSFNSGGHGSTFGSAGSFGGGSTKYLAPSYLPPKTEGFGSLDSVAAFSSGGHLPSPPGTTYGIPTASYGVPSSISNAASSGSPQYYVKSSKPSHGSFGEGSTSYRASSSGHSGSTFSSAPKYSFGGHSSPSSRYGPAKDAQGAHSESSYNTIKYSEELKPHAH